MKEQLHVIYHNKCLDGLMSAAVVLHKYKEEADVHFYPANYQEPLPDLPEGRVITVDFSYPKEVMVELAKTRDVLVLDHHRTAQENLLGLQFALFDMTECGATLSWKHFFPNTELPLILSYIRDRDLWLWEYDQTKYFTAGLRYFVENTPQGFEQLLSDPDLALKVIKEGKIAHQVQEIQSLQQLSGMYWSSLPGRTERVPTVNTNHLISETCHNMIEQHPEAPYVVAWYKKNENTVCYSLRSAKGTGANVSEIAKQYGGGGHYNAAGFTITECAPLSFTHKQLTSLTHTVGVIEEYRDLLKKLRKKLNFPNPTVYLQHEHFQMNTSIYIEALEKEIDYLINFVEVNYPGYQFTPSEK